MKLTTVAEKQRKFNRVVKFLEDYGGINVRKWASTSMDYVPVVRGRYHVLESKLEEKNGVFNIYAGCILPDNRYPFLRLMDSSQFGVNSSSYDSKHDYLVTVNSHDITVRDGNNLNKRVLCFDVNKLPSGEIENDFYSYFDNVNYGQRISKSQNDLYDYFDKVSYGQAVPKSQDDIQTLESLTRKLLKLSYNVFAEVVGCRNLSVPTDIGLYKEALKHTFHTSKIETVFVKLAGFRLGFDTYLEDNQHRLDIPDIMRRIDYARAASSGTDYTSEENFKYAKSILDYMNNRGVADPGV